MCIGLCFFFGPKAPQWTRASSFARFSRSYTTPTTLCRTPLYGGSVRRRDLYLITHNTHYRRTSMYPVGFEPIISAGERSQTHNLNRAAIGNLAGLVQENKLIQVHGISYFINVCHPKTPTDFLCTEITLTGNLAKFHNSSLDICYCRYVLVTYKAETMTICLLRPFIISG